MRESCSLCLPPYPHDPCKDPLHSPQHPPTTCQHIQCANCQTTATHNLPTTSHKGQEQADAPNHTIRIQREMYGECNTARRQNSTMFNGRGGPWMLSVKGETYLVRRSDDGAAGPRADWRPCMHRGERRTHLGGTFEHAACMAAECIAADQVMRLDDAPDARRLHALAVVRNRGRLCMQIEAAIEADGACHQADCL